MILRVRARLVDDAGDGGVSRSEILDVMAVIYLDRGLNYETAGATVVFDGDDVDIMIDSMTDENVLPVVRRSYNPLVELTWRKPNESGCES